MVNDTPVEYRVATEDDVTALAKMRWDFRLELSIRPYVL